MSCNSHVVDLVILVVDAPTLTWYLLTNMYFLVNNDYLTLRYAKRMPELISTVIFLLVCVFYLVGSIAMSQGT